MKKEFTEARGPRRTGACCVSPMPYESIKVQIQITSKICLIGIDEMEAGQDQRYYLKEGRLVSFEENLSDFWRDSKI